VFEGVSEEQYWSVNEKLGIGRDGKGDYPPGLLVHAGGPRPTGWMVSEIWESKGLQEAFMASRLGEALQVVGVPPPTQVLDTETVNFQHLG
jgi:hypothetical protein